MRPRRPGSGSGPRSRRRAVEASEPTWGELRIDPAVEAAEALAAYCDAVDAAIHVERRISRFLPFWAGQSEGFDLPGVLDLAQRLVEELEVRVDAPALTTLRALAAVADPFLADNSRSAARRLEAAGVTAPTWAEQIGRARPVAAHAMTDPEGPDEIAVFIDFEYPDGDRHTITTFITDRLDGVAKHIGLLQTATDDAFALMDVAEAKSRMREALAITPPDGVPGGEGHFELGALAWSRVRE